MRVQLGKDRRCALALTEQNNAIECTPFFSSGISKEHTGGRCNRFRLTRSLRAFISTILILTSYLSSTQALGNEFVRLDFNLVLLGDYALGTVFLELFDDRPLTTTNFLQYVDANLYDETIMHRLVSNFVLQGGGFYPVLVTEPPPLNVSLDPTAKVDLDGDPNTPNPTVLNEFDNSPFRSNLRGTVSMAKVGGDPDSATNQFFFNLTNNSANLDNNNGGFTVFAEVVGNGMTLIDAFNGGLTTTNLNPDTDDNGIRDGGPFGTVPFTGSTLLTLDEANRVNYYKSSSVTNIPGSGLVLTAEESFIDIGATFTGGGLLIIDPGKELGTGSGISLGKSIENRGTFAPGLAIGTVSLSEFEQTSSGLLDIQLNGTAAGSEYDQVITNGAADLDGTLRVSLLSGFDPNLGDSFNILSAVGGIQGSFQSLDLPDLSAGLFWDVTKSANSFTLSVVAPDFNSDGTVNLADLAIWESEYGMSPGVQADGNGDGVVDGKDFLIWQQNYGATFPLSSINSIPEPATLLLLCLGALAKPRAVRLVLRRSK